MRITIDTIGDAICAHAEDCGISAVRPNDFSPALSEMIRRSLGKGNKVEIVVSPPLADTVRVALRIAQTSGGLVVRSISDLSFACPGSPDLSTSLAKTARECVTIAR